MPRFVATAGDTVYSQPHLGMGGSLPLGAVGDAISWQRTTTPLFGRETPEIIAMGGGKGGAGRSTLAVVLGRTLVKRARRVVLVDADTTNPVLHRRLGLPDLAPPSGAGISDPDAPLAPFVRQTHYPDLGLLTLAYARRFPFVRPKLHAPALIERLRALSCDAVIVDLPSGFDPVFTSLFALADTPVLVTEPEIGSISAATQLLRAALFHGIGYHPDCYDVEEELLLLMRELPIHLDRDALLPSYLSAAGRRVVYDTASKLIPLLVLNRVAPTPDPRRSEAYGDGLNLAWHHLLGVFPRLAGALTDRGISDRCTRRDAGLAPSDPEVERIADAVARTTRLAERFPRPITETHTAHGMFGLDPNNSSDDIGLRLEAFRELMGSGDSPVRLLNSARRAAEVLEDIEEALVMFPSSGARAEAVASVEVVQSAAQAAEPNSPSPLPRGMPRVVSDSGGERDASASESPATPQLAPFSSPPERSVEVAVVRAPTSPTDPEDDELPSPGAYLRDLRRARGISLRELSLRTKIGLKYLQAIESVDKAIMPRPVYLRGYLREIAQVFDIDETQLMDRYFGHLGHS